MTRWLVTVMLTIIHLSCLTWAAPSGFVIRVEGDRVVINRGGLDSVKVGDRFVVLRQGRNIAEVIVENVNVQDSRAVIAQLFSQEPVLAGDALSLNALPDRATEATPAPRALTPLNMSMQQTQEDYQELLSSRTHSREFSQKWSGRAGNMKDFDELSMAQVLDGIGYALIPGGGWYGPVDMLLRTANQALMTNALHDRMMRDYVARIEIEVVRWDMQLLEAYCKMQAAQQGLASVEEYNALRNQMIRDKSLDKSDVFQVKIRNIGDLNVEMAPFHWHMFLSAPGDQRVVSSRYDQVLDRKLTPKQEVLGFIYFPKVPGREELTVYMVDIYGDEGEFSL